MTSLLKYLRIFEFHEIYAIAIKSVHQIFPLAKNVANKIVFLAQKLAEIIKLNCCERLI